jgi:hypothetical protein
MISSTKQSIEDLIVELLAKNPYSEGIDLVKQVQNIRPKTVKQAVYSALASLLKNEVASKIGGKYFLSRVWLNKINKLFRNKKQITSDAVFELEEGESISYHFPSLLTCDTYWAHVFDLFIEWIPVGRPIVVWNPHEWFAIGRKNEEIDIFRQFKAKNKFALYSIHGKTALDQEFRKDWASDHVSISTGSSTEYQPNYYLNIFDSIILEVFIDEKLASKIEEFYQEYKKLNPENTRSFVNLISQKYKVRMKISRNTKKASLLRKKISKDFYIAKHLSL